MYVFISEKDHFHEFSNKSVLFWLEEELQYGDWLGGPSGDGSFSMSGQIEISEVRLTVWQSHFIGTSAEFLNQCSLLRVQVVSYSHLTAHNFCTFLLHCRECRLGLAMRIPFVCPSVCLSNACIVKKERKISPYFYTIWKIIYPSFLRKRMVVVGNPFYLKFWVSRPHWSKIANFEQIIACSASAVTPSEKSSINITRKSTTRFPMSLRWSSYVAPKSPKGGLKNAKQPFSLYNRTSSGVAMGWAGWTKSRGPPSGGAPEFQAK